MVFHIVISVLLIVLVLLQFGKGAEAGLLSGGGDASFTGAQQGNILTKITTVLAVLFLGNSILLAKIQSNKSTSSILDGEAPVAAPLNNDAPMKAQEKKEEAAPAKTETK
jgi:preprotein translocase subunit SecG